MKRKVLKKKPNPVAQELSRSIYRNKIVKQKTKYNRKKNAGVDRSGDYRIVA